MKRSFLYAMVLIAPVVQAQTPPKEWFATRFGVNIPFPSASVNQAWDSYKNYGYNDGDALARYNNTKKIMVSGGIKQVSTGRKYLDPECHQWQDAFEISDMLPANTSVRVHAGLGEHYPYPDSAIKPLGMDRATRGIIDRAMFRGNDLNNSLKILWTVSPVVWPHPARSDNWTNIRTNPYGSDTPSTVAGQEPSMRDWYRPVKEYHPYLKSQFQEFVYWVNNAAYLKARALTPSNEPVTMDVTQRIGFQLGNEPAAGHPGGSSFGQVGSWKGIGAVLQGTTTGIEYKPTTSLVQMLNLPTTLAPNPLNLPAFSFLTEGTRLVESQMEGKVRAFMDSGALAAGLNEIATYGAEMDQGTWASQCGRRSVHFRSPHYRWKFNNNDFNNVQNETDMLFYGPGDPVWGRWETPQEYAKRWVKELEKVVDLIAGLPMPTASKVVDITECYLTNGEMCVSYLDNTATLPNGSKLDFAQMSQDDIRNFGRRYSKQGSVIIERLAAQVPPSRAEVMVAIRNELYKRDVVDGNLSKNLGKIFWWGTYHPDPRFETGIYGDGAGNATFYSPYMDFRINADELKAFYGN
jgi:hypothetical protein